MNTEHLNEMDLTISLAREAMSEGNGPSGCIIVGVDGRVLSKSRNQVQITGDPTAHSELEAIRALTATHDVKNLSDLTLYTTMEPCPMCGWAIIEAGISRVVIGAMIASFHTSPTGNYSLKALCEMTGRHLKIISGIRENECKQLRYEALEMAVRKELIAKK
jgi:tRNA(adenine34) deaminase